jgi:regulator of cell morphogenesis and NO signaling
MNDITKKTLASIVLDNPQRAAVLEKYNLDFCCKGKRNLAEACSEKGLETNLVAEELESVNACSNPKSMPFTEMNNAQLINYIVVRHHFYVKRAMPIVMMHLEKVVTKHGESYPYMKEVLRLFGKIETEMNSHMQKEELVLFPRILEVERAAKQNQPSCFNENYIGGPLSVMETEHKHAGNDLDNIRKLTNNYEAPVNACTTFRVCLAELKEFEEDLHEHVHLENNILFPNALQLTK